MLGGTGPYSINDIHRDDARSQFLGGDDIYREATGKYETPGKLSTYTADDSYNEIIMNTLIVDENGQTEKMQPDYVIYIKDKTDTTLEELESDSTWINSKKVASQFGIPIVMIDRQKVEEAERTKISTMSKMIRNGEYTTQDLIQFIHKVAHYENRYGNESILEYAPKEMLDALKHSIEERTSEEMKSKKISIPQIERTLTQEEIATRRKTILERQKQLQESMQTFEGEEK